jgi:hypothetical protein
MLDTEWKEKRLRLIGSIGLRGKPPYLEFARGKMVRSTVCGQVIDISG